MADEFPKWGGRLQAQMAPSQFWAQATPSDVLPPENSGAMLQAERADQEVEQVKEKAYTVPAEQKTSPSYPAGLSVIH